MTAAWCCFDEPTLVEASLVQRGVKATEDGVAKLEEGIGTVTEGPVELHTELSKR